MVTGFVLNTVLLWLCALANAEIAELRAAILAPQSGVIEVQLPTVLKTPNPKGDIAVAGTSGAQFASDGV
jgi:hypothetical protein